MGSSAFILPPVPGLVHCLVCICAMPFGHISSQFRRLEIDAVFLYFGKLYLAILF